MNLPDAQTKAKALQTLLQQYARTNDTAEALLNALTPLIDGVLTGQLHTDVSWRDIPGGRTFEETDARTLPGLESAYAKFAIAITGGESDALKAFRERRGH